MPLVYLGVTSITETIKPKSTIQTNQEEINPTPSLSIPQMKPGTSEILRIRVSKTPVTEPIQPQNTNQTNQKKNTDTPSGSNQEVIKTEPLTRELSYKCDKCKRLFKNKSNLTRHTQKSCKS